MKSFRLVTNEIPIKPSEFKLKTLEACRDKLNTSKTKLDKLFTDKRFAIYWKQFDPFAQEKQFIEKTLGAKHVTNAWLKCIELITHFKLINEEYKTDESKDSTFTHFDNAAFPGAFIMAVEYYIKTKRKFPHNWYASSLLSVNEQTSSPLEDKYDLYKKYPERWMMNKENNGDVLVKANQLDFQKRVGGKIDLYTSDLGFDVSSDYNKQEEMQMRANIGQILTGLLILKPGGNFITKQYTVFSAGTISVMQIAATCFDEFYLCKPYTSREANSETYLVGKGFKGIKKEYIDELFRMIEQHKPTESSFDLKSYPAHFIEAIVSADILLTNSQIEKIEHDIERCEEAIKERHDIFKDRGESNPVVLKFKESIQDQIEKWYYDMELCSV